MNTLHVVIRVGETQYVLPATEVLHMESYEGATPVPGAPSWVAGLVQVRRRVVPVVDLGARFGGSPLQPSLQARVVVVQLGERVVGLAVDSAREVVHLQADQFRPPPEVVVEQAEGFVKAVAHVGQRLLMLLDVERVIGGANIHGSSNEAAIHGE
jgi:purine-binding chemotaxis protein CheW